MQNVEQESGFKSFAGLKLTLLIGSIHGLYFLIAPGG